VPHPFSWFCFVWLFLLSSAFLAPFSWSSPLSGIGPVLDALAPLCSTPRFFSLFGALHFGLFASWLLACPALLVVSVFLAFLCLFSWLFCLCSWVWCLVFLAVDWSRISSYRWIISQADEFLAFQTLYLITDNRDLLAATVSSTAGLSHWPMVAAWWKERIRYVGPYGERTTVVFVPTVYQQTLVCPRCTRRGQEPIFWMRVFFSSQTSTLLSLIVTVPVTLFEIQELWLSCAETDSPADEGRQPAAIPSSSIAPAEKRARSVDTGQATQQQPGPPIKLPKSRSVENLMASADR